FPSLDLPPGTHWKSDGFSGAVLLYQTLLTSGDPHSYLQDLWTALLTAGRHQLRSTHTTVQ
ncbi:MAG: hypothetical protein ACR2QZ_16740, partial [Woeseiaceae bacterium]